MAANGCGAKSSTGATSCAKWLPSTSIGPAIGKTEDDEEREGDPGHRNGAKEPIRVTKVKQARRVDEPDPGDELARRQQAPLAEQRRELIERDAERDQVDDPEPALEQDAREPVVGGVQPVRHRSRGTIAESVKEKEKEKEKENEKERRRTRRREGKR
ncbi:MAG: hypothetical protein LC689_08750 [Myxococcales bacterium]|nr:hypothetical protein [Myxococcales bacterium]